MAKGRIYISDHPENPPGWYWVSGLHGACIVGVETYEFPIDYNRYYGKKRNSQRNLLVLKINAKQAIYDDKVKEIRLFNYKILTEHNLVGREEVWWLADRLVDCGKYYTLEIDMQDFESFPKDFTIKIKFEWAEVDRK